MRISDWSSDVCSSDLFDRDQRHFERYGTDSDGPNPIEQSGLDAPLIFELGNMRSLLANWAFVQSIMSIDDPDRLMLDYTRQMMGFLLFNPSPQTIEMIDRKSVVEGQSVSVRVAVGGRRIIKK